MLALKVEKRLAQKAKQELLAGGAFATGFKAFSKGAFVFFPALREVSISVKHSFVRLRFRQTRVVLPLKKALAKILPPEELEEAFASYDLVGDIALIEIPRKFLSRRREIARILLASNKRVKTVLRKVGKRKGLFRIRTHEWLAGRKNLETLHRENHCLFKVNVEKVFFNPKMATEREQMVRKVKNGEKVLVLFAGVGPFAIEIAREKKCTVKALELNPYAVKLLHENLRLNKRLKGTVEAIHADVREFMPREGKWADRILMPMYFGSEPYLGVVVKNAKRNCIIHYFTIGWHKEGVFSKARKAIRRACVQNGRKFKILSEEKHLAYAPRASMVVIEFRVL